MHEATAIPPDEGDFEELESGFLGVKTILGVFSSGHVEKISSVETFARAQLGTRAGGSVIASALEKPPY